MFDQLKATTALLIDVLHTRLALLSIELQEEELQLGLVLVRGFIALGLLVMAIAFTALWLIAAFWETYRLPMISLLALVFLLCGLALWRSLIKDIQQKPKLFSTSLAELAKDRDLLR